MLPTCVVNNKLVHIAEVFNQNAAYNFTLP